MGKIICIANQKGGVGKTTLTANIGAALTLEGKTVLLVDLDAQCSLTMSFGYDPNNFDNSIVTVLDNPSKVGQAIFETDVENLSILPASTMLITVDSNLISKRDRYERLKKALDKVKPLFDYILIDCSPALSTITINALVVADYILTPAETKIASHFSLDAFVSTIETMKAVRNPNLQSLGVVATMYNCQANEDKEVLASIQTNNVLLGVIKRTTAVSSAVKKGLPCVLVNRRTVVAQEFRTITNKIIEKVEG
ncbi:ParA family protein [Sinanaerobacter sp. ZZT-01]|uniref:ParA family protein n=1 Tax=Sinanaerobacter sp. ZZT-01 TaxID=3111540 RepID=UPI002D77AE43|nr:AAA family ATPase [Sinanaerobacter sp. ZZT-01]WRR92698.1 AAA family ATPase [Sinanaerobacter sp. ZZT-01]